MKQTLTDAVDENKRGLDPVRKNSPQLAAEVPVAVAVGQNQLLLFCPSGTG